MRLLRGVFGRHQSAVPFASEINAYKRLQKRGLEPDGIIDVGAYEGGWTKAARAVWESTPVLMIEPQAAKREGLERICRELADVHFEQVLLAADQGCEEKFYEMETGSSIYPERSNVPRRTTNLTTTTLDRIAAHMPGEALFLKIDVQGAEIEVLKGGQETLNRTVAIQLEVPFVRYNEGTPNFSEIISFMGNAGFSAIEISNSTIMRDVMVQSDLIFVKNDSHLLSPLLEF